MTYHKTIFLTTSKGENWRIEIKWKRIDFEFVQQEPEPEKNFKEIELQIGMIKLNREHQSSRFLSAKEYLKPIDKISVKWNYHYGN